MYTITNYKQLIKQANHSCNFLEQHFDQLTIKYAKNQKLWFD